jgi:hypothetical protein
VLRQDLGALGSGEHQVTLQSVPPSGIYWARVMQADRSASTRVVLVW